VQFQPHELAQQRAIKSAFDPAWLLNPAKVFPLQGGSAPALAAE
jgi:glycolate oxidase